MYAVELSDTLENNGVRGHYFANSNKSNEARGQVSFILCLSDISWRYMHRFLYSVMFTC